MDLERLLTCEEVAQCLGLKVSTVRKMIYNRQLPTVHPTGARAVRVPRKAVEKIVAQYEPHD